MPPSEEPLFYLQIVDREGHVVHLPGGGPLERNLIELMTAAIVAKGVGFGKTEAAVKASIRDGLTEAMQSLKAQTRLLV